jgi:small-conductance mechanosensitive channel
LGCALLVGAGTIILKLIGIIIIFLLVKGIGSALIKRSFRRITERNNISIGRSKTLQSLTLNLFSYILIFIFVVMVFEIFDYDAKALIAGAGVVGLAIGFGAQKRGTRGEWDRNSISTSSVYRKIARNTKLGQYMT